MSRILERRVPGARATRGERPFARACLAVGVALAALVSGGCGGKRVPDAIERVEAPDAERPEVFERVWYRASRRVGFRPFKAGGDLAVYSDRLEFRRGSKQDPEIRWRLMLDRIEQVSLGKLKGDRDSDWVAIQIKDASRDRVVALHDGGNFGFGTNTAELYELIRGALERARAGQFDVPDGFQALDGLGAQINLGIPQDWTAEAVEVLVQPDGKSTQGTAHLVAPDGAVIRLERRAATGRGACAKIGRRLSARLAKELGGGPDGTGSTVAVVPEEATVGSCRGVRFRGGEGDRVVDAVAVARYDTLFLLSLSCDAACYERHRADFERIVDTVRFPVTRVR